MRITAPEVSVTSPLMERICLFQVNLWYDLQILSIIRSSYNNVIVSYPVRIRTFSGKIESCCFILIYFDALYIGPFVNAPKCVCMFLYSVYGWYKDER